MTDQNSQFFAILTAVGEAKQANAAALGTSWTFAQMGVGDANETSPIPNRLQTKLINERRRAPLNQVKVDPTNPSVIIAEQVIPESVGGWWVRELALYDTDGDMVAVANCAPTYKPLLAQGSGRTQVIRINLIVSSTANIELKIDPSVVLATREYVDTSVIEALAKLDFKHSVLVATTANIVLSGIQTVDGVLLTADARVLVKDQAQAKDNGIYVVPAGGAWRRAQDADASVEVTPGLFVSVEKGTANGDSVWQLVTDAPIVLGTTALTFEVVAGRTGVVAGTYRSLTVDKLGRVIAGTNPTTLAAAGITDGRTLMNNTFDQVVIAKQGLSVPAGYGFNFYSADLASTYYRVGHDASMWTFIVRLTDTSEVSAFNVGRATGKVSFSQRPTFAGNTPWDSGNFDPATVVAKTGAVMSGSVVLNNGGEDSPEFGFRTQTSEVYMDLYNKNFRIFSRINGVESTPFLIDLENKGASIFNNALWTNANFKPSDYIKKGESVLSGANPVFQSAGFGAIAAIPGGAGSFQISGADAPSSAVMCFHRPSSYGVMFGLDTDNQLKLGGWSAGAVAHTIWHSGNRPKDTALLAPSGWSKNADTGEIKQWVEVVVDDISTVKLLSVSWPFQFPNSFLNAHITFRIQAAGNIGCASVGSYHSASTSGCTIRVEEYSGVLQAGMVAIVEARGY